MGLAGILAIAVCSCPAGTVLPIPTHRSEQAPGWEGRDPRDMGVLSVASVLCCGSLAWAAWYDLGLCQRSSFSPAGETGWAAAGAGRSSGRSWGGVARAPCRHPESWHIAVLHVPSGSDERCLFLRVMSWHLEMMPH